MAFTKTVDEIRNIVYNPNLQEVEIPSQIIKCNKACKIITTALKNAKGTGEKQHLTNALANIKSFKTMLNAMKILGQGYSPRKETSSNRVKWENVESAFKGRIRTGVIINIKHSIDIEAFLQDAETIFDYQIKKALKINEMLKVNSVFCGLFIHKKDDKEVEELKYFNTKNAPIYGDTNLRQWFRERVQDPIITDLSEFQERESVISSVDAVLGRSATLPCDIDPETNEDRVYMVLWYRDGYHKPIYSFDARGRAKEKAVQWSDPAMFGPRAYFVTVSTPAVLTLDGVQLDDEGVYRCRVDFRTSPTKNSAINLTVIVPPNNLLIYDNSGREVSCDTCNGTVGPLEEGADLVLTCEVRGGRPSPTVSWFVDDRNVEGHVESVGGNVVVNRLEARTLSRTHLNSVYRCQASNTKLMMPNEKSVRLEMHLRPQSVVVPIKPRQLVANEDITIHCEVTGSRPRAEITWTRDNRPFRRGKLNEEGNETVISSVTFAPVPEDDQTVLKCIGENPYLRGFVLEDSLKLNVVYAPLVTLTLGSTLNPEDIKEGDDVYFECGIRSNPKQHKIMWFHDGVLVNQSLAAGIIISTHSLVLQGVTRSQGGFYTCTAANSRGETTSDPVLLRVRYAPVCSKDSEVTVIGASLDEALRVRCRVSADPADVAFTWQFNNSGESFDVAPTRVATPAGNISELVYTPASARDYGTLTCWGRNAVGQQAEPCVFQVVPASKPSPLTNCTLHTVNNQTSDVVEVECKAGYDGGLPQSFTLEAYDAKIMRLRFNLTSIDTENPVFRLDLTELLPIPTSLRIFVYAQNAKGKSEKLILEDIMLNDAEKRTDGSSGMSLVPLAGLLTGALLTLGVAALVIVVVAVRRKRLRNGGSCGGTRCSHHIALDATKQTTKGRQGSMLEINTGDNRYVVAYTLKPPGDCAPSPPSMNNVLGVAPEQTREQPDILNTPRAPPVGVADVSPSGLPQPDGLFSPMSDSSAAGKLRLNCTSPSQFSTIQSPSSGGGDPTTTIGGTLGRHRPRPRDSSFSSFATVRRDHIIADTIPGPESCV